MFDFPCCNGMKLDMLVAVALKHWLLYVKLIKLVACFVVLSFVSIQVMLVGRAKALFMDEISSGLDSSTT
jgi:hypothetical protein